MCHSEYPGMNLSVRRECNCLINDLIIKRKENPSDFGFVHICGFSSNRGSELETSVTLDSIRFDLCYWQPLARDCVYSKLLYLEEV